MEVIFMLKELYEKRNIPLAYMAQMTHVGERTLHKYDRGEKIRDDSKRRIEIMLDVIESNNVIFPKCYPGDRWAWLDNKFPEISYKMKRCEYLARQNKDWVEPKR
jgi:hypothetical protein